MKQIRKQLAALLLAVALAAACAAPAFAAATAASIELTRKGGITVTGGEPLLQIEFVTALFREAKRRGIHTCLDTSGATFRPEDAAALLLAGLERRCGYCCVNTVHLQTRTLESLCLVYDSDMLLRLEPGEEETEDWIVRRSTPEQIRRTLRALVREGAPQ